MIFFTLRVLWWFRTVFKLLAALTTLTFGVLIETFYRHIFEKHVGENGFTIDRIDSTDSFFTILIVVFAAGAVFFHVFDIYVLGKRTRNADIITASLHSLYGIMFGDEPEHRITFFAKAYPWSKYIQPLYRYAYGTGTKLNSKARFYRGESLVGLAWESPGGRKFYEREVPDFKDNMDDLRDFMVNKLKTDSKHFDRFGQDTLHIRWLYCYGIVSKHSGEFIGVICIDSRDPNALKKINIEAILSIALTVGSVFQFPYSY